MGRGVVGKLVAGAAALTLCWSAKALAERNGQAPGPWAGVLDEHPKIQYAIRPPTDRVAKLCEALAAGRRTLTRDAQTGYLRSVLDALDVPTESQLLVFSKTGVQRAYTNPHTARSTTTSRWPWDTCRPRR